MTIGFIGLGIMGSRMAANLQQRGHALVVYNRSRDKAEALVAGGATLADSPADVARQVDTLFTVLSTPEAVARAALGADGFLGALPAGARWVDCSTVHPSFAREMACKAAGHRARYIDAPVGGSKQQAAAAQLIFLVGGDAEDVEAVRPLLECMGRAVKHVGAHGMGTSLKLVLNKMLAEAMLSFAEAMALGRALGLSREVLMATIPGSVVAAPFLEMKRAGIESGDYEAHFPLQWMHKDMQMVTTSGYERGVPLPLANVTKEVYAQAKQRGMGELDFSAIYQFVDAANDDSIL